MTPTSRVLRRVALGLAALAAAGFLLHAGAAFWAWNEFTQAESVVALHTNMLVRGEGLYYNLQTGPFTASVYGPIFYLLSALLRLLGFAPFAAARLISLAALLGLLWLICVLLRQTVYDFRVRITGILLAAASAPLLLWGTVGQVDMLACCFALGAIRFAHARKLGLAGGFVLLSLFTKQSFVAAPAAIAVYLWTRNRRSAALWTASAALAGASAAALLNAATGGNYLSNAFQANLNPFAAIKLQQQLIYFASVSGTLLLLAATGLAGATRRDLLPYLYAGLSLVVFLATAPKVGSDLNYQIEPVVALIVCSAVALDRLRFFDRIGAPRGWIPLLQLPLLLYFVCNFCVSGLGLIARVTREAEQREETAAVRPWLDGSAPVLSVQLNPLVHCRGRIEVEPFIYTHLVDAGLANPEPVRQRLMARGYGTVILYEDVFASAPAFKNPEMPTLPGPHLEALRANYRLVAHIPGPYLAGDYIYAPRGD